MFLPIPPAATFEHFPLAYPLRGAGPTPTASKCDTPPPLSISLPHFLHRNPPGPEVGAGGSDSMEMMAG